MGYTNERRLDSKIPKLRRGHFVYITMCYRMCFYFSRTRVRALGPNWEGLYSIKEEARQETYKSKTWMEDTASFIESKMSTKVLLINVNEFHELFVSTK